MNNKRTIMILILVLFIGIIGLTVAYFSNSTNVDNIFETKPYGTTVEETFNAPSSWLPGDITKKEITATNTGEVDEAVRISFEESWTPYNTSSTLNGWIHQDGSKSSHTTESELATDERVAIINFDNDSDWDYEDGYYYYKYKIAPGETTSSLIKSVTFNSKTKLDDTCTTTEGNGTKTITCNSSGSDYDHATYTLAFTVETIQYDKYASAWELPQNTTIAIGGSKPQGFNFAQAIMSKSNAASITNYTDGVTTEAYTFNHEATAQTPALTDYRYIGASPNNYVEFNCDDNGENCEVWRAIGVFYVDDGNNNWEWRVKLVRGTNFNEDLPWDDNNDYEKIDEWNESVMNTYLNGVYLNSLSVSAKSQIGDAKYYLGRRLFDSTEHFGSTEEIYFWERDNEKYYDTILLSWIGKIALLYPSDVYMTYSNSVNETCYNDPYLCDNTTASWIYNTFTHLESSYGIWLLSPVFRSQYGQIFYDDVSHIYINGNLTFVTASMHLGTSPVLYLSSSVKTTSGDGSIDSPYKLSL